MPVWRPELGPIDCLQAGRDSRERAKRFFDLAARYAAKHDLVGGREALESFDVHLELAFVELEIAHYWLERGQS